jgi:subtilisin family serine protease
MLKTAFAALVGLSSSVALGATVAIIDSGVDVDHADLKKSVWVNPIDGSFDLFDDDGNGKTDDVYGWNFLDNNNVLIDLTQTSLLTSDIKTFFTLQGKVLTGTATEEQKTWLKKKISDSSFRSRITQYGAFAHGTHVAGIASEFEGNKVFTIRLIPTKILCKACWIKSAKPRKRVRTRTGF